MENLNLDASVVQRAALRSFWEGWGFEAKCDQMQKKIVFFTFCLLSGSFPFFGRFFVLPSLLLFLALSGGHSSLSFVPPTASPPLKLYTRVAHIPPPPPAPSAIVRLTPNPLKLRVCHRLTLLFASP